MRSFKSLAAAVLLIVASVTPTGAQAQVRIEVTEFLECDSKEIALETARAIVRAMKNDPNNEDIPRDLIDDETCVATFFGTGEFNDDWNRTHIFEEKVLGGEIHTYVRVAPVLTTSSDRPDETWVGYAIIVGKDIGEAEERKQKI